MSHAVVFDPDAEEDLAQIGEWIAERAGETIALNYVEALRSYCRGFSTFPERGTRREDLKAGLRTIGFRRRVTIVFTVEASRVVILRLFYGGRSLDALIDLD